MPSIKARSKTPKIIATKTETIMTIVVKRIVSDREGQLTRLSSANVSLKKDMVFESIVLEYP